MPSTVNTPFLSDVVNKLLSFNFCPRKFSYFWHFLPAFDPLRWRLVYLKFYIYRHVYVRFCLIINKKFKFKDLSTATQIFHKGIFFFLILPKSHYHHIEIFPYLWKFLTFRLWSITGFFRFSGFFNHACFFSGFCKRPFIVLSKFLYPEEPRYHFCHFSWWWLWRRSWLCSEENEQFDHPCWFARNVSVRANSNYLLA